MQKINWTVSPIYILSFPLSSLNRRVISDRLLQLKIIRMISIGYPPITIELVWKVSTTLSNVTLVLVNSMIIRVLLTTMDSIKNLNSFRFYGCRLELFLIHPHVKLAKEEIVQLVLDNSLSDLKLLLGSSVPPAQQIFVVLEQNKTKMTFFTFLTCSGCLRINL